MHLGSKATSKDWQRDAAKELEVGCDKLAQAAKEVREGTRDWDPELAILAEEVLDVATRGLVVSVRVGAPGLGQDKPDPGDKPNREEKPATTVAAVPTVMGLTLSANSKRKWPGATVPLLQDAVTPLSKAAEILGDHEKESASEVTVLREEVIDIVARLAAADARVAAAPDPPRQSKRRIGTSPNPADE